MKKILNTFAMLGVLLMAALGTTSCLYGIGHDEEIGGGSVTDTGLKVNVSATVIYADGSDAATFDATFNGEPLTDGDVTFYDVETGEVLDIVDMSFSTGFAGTTKIRLKYIDDEGNEHLSEVFSIEAILEFDLTPNGNEGLTVSLSTSLLQLGKGAAIFIVRYNGEVVGADEIDKVKCYDVTNDTPVSLTTTEVTDEAGTLYRLLTFTPEATGERSFWFSYKRQNTLDKPISIRTVDIPIPARPADAQPSNTSFKRRVLLEQFTGTWCGNCPYMIRAVENVFADEKYADRTIHVSIHDDDKFEIPEIGLAAILGVGSFPTSIIDFAYRIENYGVENNTASIKAVVDNILKSKPSAGIAVRSSLKDNTLLVRASVKAAEQGEYFVGAWLLESGLYSPQANSSGLVGEFDTHENVVRIADSNPSYRNYMGYPLGVINAGERADYLFAMELDEEWKRENCHLVLFVSTSGRSSQQITNVVRTTSLTSGLAFDYE